MPRSEDTTNTFTTDTDTTVFTTSAHMTHQTAPDFLVILCPDSPLIPVIKGDTVFLKNGRYEGRLSPEDIAKFEAFSVTAQ